MQFFKIIEKDRIKFHTEMQKHQGSLNNIEKQKKS